MRRSVRIVEEGSIEAPFVFGEIEAVLRPGLHFVPAEYRSEVRKAAER